MISFFMAMIPPTVTAQEHKVDTRGKRPRFYDPPELKAARQKLTDHLAKHRPTEPFGGPLELNTSWFFPIPETGGYHDGDPKITKPDTDNLQKLLKDCMTVCGYWKDDAQVFREICTKVWVAERPGIFIEINAWDMEAMEWR